ncbi:MAG TPA: UPF0158 family protein [Polyangiaceae bacterium]|jgi:hypothetical protein|nr:UPF0158 family protein [Polyangiaceae bacterium]
MADSNSGGGGQQLREIPVDWEALEDAFENNAPEVHSYLHLGTGEVLRVVDGIADPEMHSRIASDVTYMRIEPVSSREQYRWMERFIPMVEEGDLRDQLGAAIDGKGAFRRFKDVLMTFGTERERWFTFRSERLRVFMEAWLSAHGLTPVARPVWAAETPPEAPISQDALSARRKSSAEALRKQLRELADTLGARDLEKVTVFAEFVKARRAARGFAHRPDASGNPAEAEHADADVEAPIAAPSEPKAVEEDDEEATPSSRKRPAAR